MMDKQLNGLIDVCLLISNKTTRLPKDVHRLRDCFFFLDGLMNEHKDGWIDDGQIAGWIDGCLFVNLN